MFQRKRVVLALAGMVTAAVGAVACSGGGGSGGGTPTPTPTPGGPLTVTLEGQGFGADTGKYALFRVLSGTTVLFCNSGLISGGSPSFSIASPAILTTAGANSAEAYLATKGTGVAYVGSGNPANRDPAYGLTIGRVTTNIVMVLDSSAATSGITWTNATDCPG